MKSLDSFEDLLDNPEDFGFCSFQDFVKNREKWRAQLYGRHDDEIASIDAGSRNLGCRQVYYLDTQGQGRQRLDSLEQGERIAREMGLDFFKDFVVKPEVREDPGTKRGYMIEVEFVPKRRFAS